MADSENSNASDKKVKTEQTASETIVGDASAEIKRQCRIIGGCNGNG